MHLHKFSILIFLLLACNKMELPPNVRSTVNMEADSIVFAVIGDYGDAGEPARQVSELVKSWSPDFVITLGDNNYPNGEMSTMEANISQYYCDFIYNPGAPTYLQCKGLAKSENQNRFFPTLGNHDFKNINLNIPYLNFFSLPGKEVYYEFMWGPVHFFALNSGPDGAATCCISEQAFWLKEKLSNSNSLYKIVYFHHPPFSSSKHGSNESMQWPFADWGADAVLSGHDHVYQRIIKLAEPDLVYLVNGVGGRQSFYGCDVKPLSQDLFDDVCIGEKFGAIKGKATSEKLSFQFYSIDDDQALLDEVVIRR